MRDALWIHFIDNNGALGSLVNGSSSVEEHDVVVGCTWALIAELNVLAWFDRVDSKSNPVDGLSRKNFKGVWRFRQIYFPKAVLEALQAVCPKALRRPFDALSSSFLGLSSSQSHMKVP